MTTQYCVCRDIYEPYHSVDLSLYSLRIARRFTGRHTRQSVSTQSLKCSTPHPMSRVTAMSMKTLRGTSANSHLHITPSSGGLASRHSNSNVSPQMYANALSLLSWVIVITRNPIVGKLSCKLHQVPSELIIPFYFFLDSPLHPRISFQELMSGTPSSSLISSAERNAAATMVVLVHLSSSFNAVRLPRSCLLR